MNTIKNGYVRVIDWIEDYPQASFWLAVVLIALALFV